MASDPNHRPCAARSTSDLHSNQAQILDTFENWSHTESGPVLCGVLVTYRLNDEVYYGSMLGRSKRPSRIDVSSLADVVRIPKSFYQPLYEPCIIQTPSSDREKIYVKRSPLAGHHRIINGDRPKHIAEAFLREVKTYELLRQHHHPNIAHYLGCEVQDGRIAGICLETYPESLAARLESQVDAKSSRKHRAIAIRHRGKILSGLESAISFLHSIKLVHNDLTPSNIMLLEDNTPVVIDFSSCRRIGESLEGIRRTYGWHDKSVTLSIPQNDLDALKDIAVWLATGGEKPLRFND